MSRKGYLSTDQQRSAGLEDFDLTIPATFLMTSKDASHGSGADRQREADIDGTISTPSHLTYLGNKGDANREANTQLQCVQAEASFRSDHIFPAYFCDLNTVKVLDVSHLNNAFHSVHGGRSVLAR